MLRKSAPLLALLASALLPLSGAAAQEPAARPAQDGAARSETSSPLVSTEWLEKNLDAKGLRIVEVSVEPGVFERGHIPGAQNVVWHTDLVETVSRDIAGPEKFAALVRRLGIDKDTPVVLYGDNNNWFAAWGAWVLAQYGLVDNVKLLDGGRKKWEAEKRPLDTRSAEVAASRFTPPPVSPALRARFGDVLAVARKERDEQILDIRSPDEFSGKIIAPPGVQELAIRAGHIPGSVNVPWGKAVNADGTIKSPAELRALYAAAGIDGSKPIITSCRIGERSSHSWFVLSRILGYQVRNYDGSWTEYGNAVGVPVVNLAGTVWGGK
ncbi:Putative thiosulfate sulfurtransferase [Methylobacterium dankookense]|uniref:Sulfurtransferase n=1 Tax=Methylobacterium dankookense TaxID=560405 RepID=A0A564G4P5_9HYPH|nr:sulfurtransferase [Methylobacterium dankookense]GJD57569.1 Putative thiosulfate sulfurtransferase [Methylobacterium dankookense]VUF15483.1 Putative thiosulfate sulfurtransferase [Methylobacterium dankookense]